MLTTFRIAEDDFRLISEVVRSYSVSVLMNTEFLAVLSFVVNNRKFRSSQRFEMMQGFRRRQARLWTHMSDFLKAAPA